MNDIADSLWLAWSLITHADAVLLRIVALSLRVSLSACAVGASLGLGFGAWLAVARFPGHAALVWALNTLLALPSVVVGLAVYLLLSRAGPLGALGILFTPTAMVIAQSILVVPLIAALARRLVLDGLREGGEQLRVAGRRPAAVGALLMLLHERLGVLTILLTAFGRAISEVGAVMIVGGNIDGFTRVMTTAIALETSKGRPAAGAGAGPGAARRGRDRQPAHRRSARPPRAASGSACMSSMDHPAFVHPGRLPSRGLARSTGRC